jgi:hypothetical protein
MTDSMGLRSRTAGLLIGVLAAPVLSLLIAAWVLHLGEAHLSLPWSYAGGGDTKFYLLVIKGILDHGWFEHNPSLGAPFGLELYDFPQGADNLNLLIVKTLGIFSSNPAWVLNVFFLLTFPLTAVSAYLALRALGASTGAAIVCATLFALLPYHFYRAESQVLLSAYYSVPLGALLFLRLWQGPGLFARRGRSEGEVGETRHPPHHPAKTAAESQLPRRRPGGSAPIMRALGWISPRSLLTVAICVVIGSAGLYYAVFALVLLLGGSVVAPFARRGRRTVISGLLCSLAIVVMLAINLAPSLSYQSAHGKNTAIARTPLQSDQFGLRLSNLLLPVQEDRLPFLSDVNQRYTEATATGYCEQCFENLGTVGSLGFLSLCLLALVSIVGVAGAFAVRAVYRAAALGVALSFAVATIGGISSLLAFFVTSDIRGWNRMSLFIAFFSLLTIALLLDAGARRLARRRPGTGGRVLAGALLAVVLVLGAVDETSSYFLPNYEKDAREWRSDATFVRQIETRMPQGAAIFELPYVPFPEGYGSISTSISAPNTTFDTTYELGRGYIHSKSLRWSFGAMKGRATDWQGQLAPKPLYLSLAAAAEDGFQGLWVDPHGYATKLRKRLAPLLEKLLGVAPLLSPAHDLLFFDLRPFAATLAHRHTAAQLAALRFATLYPLRTACETSESLELINPSDSPRAATLTMQLSIGAEGPSRVLVHYPGGGAAQAVAATGAKLALKAQLSLPPGTSAVRFSAPGVPVKPAARVGGFAVADATLTEAVLTPFESAPRKVAAGSMVAGALPPPCQQTVAAVHTIK